MEEAANASLACIICQQRFLRSQRLAMERHVAIFHGNCTFSTRQCDMCQRKYYDVEHFTDHLRTSPGCEFGEIVPYKRLPHLKVHLRSLVDQMMRPVSTAQSTTQEQQQQKEAGDKSETTGGTKLQDLTVINGSADKEDRESRKEEPSASSSTVSTSAKPSLMKKSGKNASKVASAAGDPTEKSSAVARKDNPTSPKSSGSSRKSSCADQVEMIEIDQSCGQSESSDTGPAASVKRRGRKRSLEISTRSMPRKIQKWTDLKSSNFGGDGGIKKRQSVASEESESDDRHNARSRFRSYSFEVEMKKRIEQQILDHRPSIIVQCTICESKIQTIDRSKEHFMPVYRNLRRHVELHLGKSIFACGHCHVREPRMIRLRDHLTHFHDLPWAKGNYRPLSKEQCDEILELTMKCFFGKKDEPGSLKNPKKESARNTSTKKQSKSASTSLIGSRRQKNSKSQSAIASPQISSRTGALRNFNKKSEAKSFNQPKNTSTLPKEQSKAAFTSLIGERRQKNPGAQSPFVPSPQVPSRSVISLSGFLKDFIADMETLQCHVCEQDVTLVDGTAEEDALGHAANHLGKSLYSCKICPRRFRYVNGVHDHLKMVHKMKVTNEYVDLRQECEGDLKSIVSICYSKAEVRIERMKMADLEQCSETSTNGTEVSDLESEDDQESESQGGDCEDGLEYSDDSEDGEEPENSLMTRRSVSSNGSSVNSCSTLENQSDPNMEKESDIVAEGVQSSFQASSCIVEAKVPKSSQVSIDEETAGVDQGRQSPKMDISAGSQSGQVEDDLELVMEVETSVDELSEKEKENIAKDKDQSPTENFMWKGPEEGRQSIFKSISHAVETEASKSGQFSVNTERQAPKMACPEVQTSPDGLIVSGQMAGNAEACQDKHGSSKEGTSASSNSTGGDALDEIMCQYEYKCETCGILADDEARMENHVRRVHGGNYLG